MTDTGNRPFYGWVIVFAAFVITLVGFGSAYSFGSFVGSLEKTFGASRGAVASVFSAAGFLYFALGAVSGPLAGRWGGKWLAFVGMALIGLGLFLASRAETLPEIYLAYGLGIGFGIGLSYVPVLGIVQRWFVRRRGLASGLAVSGIGVGTLVMPPLATVLIGAVGWRDAYGALAGIVAIAGCAAALLIEDDPGGRGQHADGMPADAVARPQSGQGLSVRDAIRTRRFLALYIACLVGSVGVFVPFVHLVPYAVDHGISPAVAVWLLGAIGIGSTAGRFFLGGLADRMGRDGFLVAMYLGMAASLAIWVVGGTFAVLAVFGLVFGLFYGGWVAILPAVVADHFGARHVGAILGALYTSVAIGTLVGPSGAGFLYDFDHSYTVPILASAVASALAAALTALAARAR